MKKKIIELVLAILKEQNKSNRKVIVLELFTAITDSKIHKSVKDNSNLKNKFKQLVIDYDNQSTDENRKNLMDFVSEIQELIY